MPKVRIPIRAGTRRVPASKPGGPPEAPERRPAAVEVGHLATREPGIASPEEEEWRDRALRLQADMANYRKRQQRIAQEQARADQDDLLSDLLVVADNLDRALTATEADTSLRRGVELTRDELARLLVKYDLERIEAQAKAFDPAWHEAIGVVSAGVLGVEPGTVVDVMQAGYRRGGRLLRPARVIVAQ